MNHFLSLTIMAAAMLATPSTPRQATARLHDGSLLRVSVEGEIEILTKYGKLVVPVQDIRNIEVGCHLPDIHVKDLGDANPKTREAAGKALLAAGTAAYPMVLEAAESQDPEVKKRAGQIVRTMQETYPADRLKASREDVIVTDGLRVTGKILSPGLKVRNAHLGELTLKLADVSEVKFTFAAPALDVQSTGEWQDSGLFVPRGSQLSIQADGQVDIYPMQPGQYMVGPLGYTQNLLAGQTPAGMLLGKFGDGQQFSVGETFQKQINSEGRLYLKIQPSQWNCPSTGSYRVKVRIE